MNKKMILSLLCVSLSGQMTFGKQKPEIIKIAEEMVDVSHKIWRDCLGAGSNQTCEDAGKAFSSVFDFLHYLELSCRISKDRSEYRSAKLANVTTEVGNFYAGQARIYDSLAEVCLDFAAKYDTEEVPDLDRRILGESYVQNIKAFYKKSAQEKREEAQEYKKEADRLRAQIPESIQYSQQMALAIPPSLFYSGTPEQDAQADLFDWLEARVNDEQEKKPMCKEGEPMPIFKKKFGYDQLIIQNKLRPVTIQNNVQKKKQMCKEIFGNDQLIIQKKSRFEIG